MAKLDRFAIFGMVAALLCCVGIAWSNSVDAIGTESISDDVAAQLRGGGCTWKFEAQDPQVNCTATHAACDTFEVWSSNSEDGEEGRTSKYCGAQAAGKFRCANEWSQPKDCAE